MIESIIKGYEIWERVTVGHDMICESSWRGKAQLHIKSYWMKYEFKYYNVYHMDMGYRHYLN